MESLGAMLPAMLLNGGAVVLLWGLLWRSNTRVVERMQESLDRRVERGYCELQHRELKDDLAEIKKSQERIMRGLDEIRIRLARENGARRRADRAKEGAA